MDDEIRERLKEIAANLYLCKVAMRYVDDPTMIDNALCTILRDLDSIVESVKE